MQTITAKWLRVLIGSGILAYGVSFSWLRYTGHVGFVIDPYCMFVLSVGLVTSFRNMKWGLLIGISAIALDVFATLLQSGEFASQPTIVVAPALILLVMLFFGRKEGLAVGGAIALSIPLAIGISGLLGWGPGLRDPGVIHGLIVLELVIAITILAMYIHTKSLEEIHRVHSQENERFRLLVESMPDGIVLISPDGLVEEFNPAAEKFLRVRRDQIIGCRLGLATFGIPQNLLTVVQTQTAQDVCMGDRCLEVTPSSTSIKAGPPRVLLMLRDISTRKEYEKRSEELQGQVMRAQKLEAVGRLAAGVAHDFNNILTVVSGYIGIRELEELSENDPVTDMGEAVAMGAKLVRQLLVFSRDEPSSLSAIDLATAVQRIEPILRRLVGDDIDLVIECAPGCVITGNYGKFEQVLVNLATNARDAMPKGGRLTILAAVDGENVILRVSDTGEGIPREIRDKIFDVFFTTKDASLGTGLGLATVYAIVTDFQGVIEVESSSDGSTFSIVWPLAYEEASIELSRAVSTTPQQLKQPRLLLVEDNNAARVMLTRYLQKKGFAVTAAVSGTAVLHDMVLRRNPPDIIVTDLVMPGISGIELINLMREHWGEVPYVLMSGYTAETLVDEPPETIRHLLEKPFRPSELAERIIEALA